MESPWGLRDLNHILGNSALEPDIQKSPSTRCENQRGLLEGCKKVRTACCKSQSEGGRLQTACCSGQLARTTRAPGFCSGPSYAGAAPRKGRGHCRQHLHARLGRMESNQGGASRGQCRLPRAHTGESKTSLEVQLQALQTWPSLWPRCPHQNKRRNPHGSAAAGPWGVARSPTLTACVRVHSVVSGSLWPHGRSPPDSSVHRILWARRLEWGVISYSRDPPMLQGLNCVSCLGTWILHHRTTAEAPQLFFTNL